MARDTAEMPPGPHALLSAAANQRRDLSSSTASSNLKRSRTPAESSIHFRIAPNISEWKCYFLTIPNLPALRLAVVGWAVMQRNPMDRVRIAGGTLRDKEPLILTPEQFGRLLQHISTEPHRTMVVVAMCLGLRRSELDGLKWSDFDWIRQEVLIQRGVIANRVEP